MADESVPQRSRVQPRLDTIGLLGVTVASLPDHAREFLGNAISMAVVASIREPERELLLAGGDGGLQPD
jgi:hypothetical protein